MSAPTAPSWRIASAPIISAHPDTTAYIETGLWHSNVARMLKDRNIPPGKILLGGFDLAPQVIEQMKAGYIQVEIDQQPYEQGFLPVMQVYLEKKAGLAPSDIDTGEAVFTPDQADKLMAWPSRACAESIRLTELSARSVTLLAAQSRTIEEAAPRMTNLFRIYLEKPELAGVALLVLLSAVFEARSGGAFLSPDNLRGILGLLPEVGLVSIGVTILMICGEFDLSVGLDVRADADGDLAPDHRRRAVSRRGPDRASSIAAAIGFVNGFITLTFAIPSFITTLGMLFIVRSLTVVISGGFPPLLPDDLPTGVFTQFIGPGGLFRASFIWFLADRARRLGDDAPSPISATGSARRAATSRRRSRWACRRGASSSSASFSAR